MDAAERLRIARQAMLEGDLGTAERIVEVVLEADPRNAEARELQATILGVATDKAGIPAEALGDLRPDTRHLEDPATFEDAIRKPSLPLGVGLLGLLAVASGGIGAFAGAVLLLGGLAFGVLLVLLGLLQLASGIGLWRLRSWAWYLSVVTLGIGFAVNAAGAFGGDVGSFFWAFAQLLALAYLVHVRGHFLSRSARRGTPA